MFHGWASPSCYNNTSNTKQNKKNPTLHTHSWLETVALFHSPVRPSTQVRFAVIQKRAWKYKNASKYHFYKPLYGIYKIGFLCCVDCVISCCSAEFLLAHLYKSLVALPLMSNRIMPNSHCQNHFTLPLDHVLLTTYLAIYLIVQRAEIASINSVLLHRVNTNLLRFIGWSSKRIKTMTLNKYLLFPLFCNILCG